MTSFLSSFGRDPSQTRSCSFGSRYDSDSDDDLGFGLRFGNYYDSDDDDLDFGRKRRRSRSKTRRRRKSSKTKRRRKSSKKRRRKSSKSKRKRKSKTRRRRRSSTSRQRSQRKKFGTKIKSLAKRYRRGDFGSMKWKTVLKKHL